MVTFRIVDPREIDWTYLDSFEDRTVFQTGEWLRFVSETQHASPIVAEIRDGADRLGYFTGLTFTRFGVKILGSSARGWTTAYMGFNLLPGVERRTLLTGLERFAFDQLRCLHFELYDRFFTIADADAAGYSYETGLNYESDLRQSEEALLGAMSPSCRWSLRKAKRSGLIIEEARDLTFADEYYQQLCEVFAKHGLVPTYGVDRVKSMIGYMMPTGRLLMIRARAPDGSCIATGIMLATGRLAYFWGNASYRRGQIHRPNEALHWYAMRYWKARGAWFYDWGGPGTYKAKYGGAPLYVPWFFKSRYRSLERLRDQARRLFRAQLRTKGWLRSLAHHTERSQDRAEAPNQESAGE